MVTGECKSAQNLDLHSLPENVHKKIVNIDFCHCSEFSIFERGLFPTIPPPLVTDLYSETLLSLADIGSPRS